VTLGERRVTGSRRRTRRLDLVTDQPRDVVGQDVIAADSFVA
jgi:hypothetical protein